MYSSKRHGTRELTEMVLSTLEYRTIKQIPHRGIKILTKYKISLKKQEHAPLKLG
jgi:hypothetical protein